MAESEIYVPKKHKIILCPGVEGVWNWGVFECFAATITAMLDMPNYKPLLESYGINEKIHPKKWKEYLDSDFQDSPELGRLWKLFEAQRPVVKLAEDYLYTILVAHQYPDVIKEFQNDSKNREAYDPFYLILDGVEKSNTEHGEQLGKLFYNKELCTGRRWLQNEDPFAWQELNRPMEHTLRELRKIVDASRRYGGENGGYEIWFVTTKGEDDSFSLCDAYRRLGLLGEDEYSETGARQCMISRNRIIGRESLVPIQERLMVEKGLKKITPEFKKRFKRIVTSYQLDIVMEGAGVPYAQIVKLDDRFGMGGLKQVYKKHARQVIVTGGFAFDWQIDEAEDNDFVDVVNGENMGLETGELIKSWGY